MIDKKPYFSIIMPVYNGEKYLAKAVQSVLNQSFRDLELIVINDNSTDKSLNIIQSLAAQDKRVLIHTTDKNCGVANARNVGLNYIQGQYFSFVDADDYLEPDTLLNVKYKLEATKAQVLKYGCIEEYYNKQDKLLGVKKVKLVEAFFEDDIAIKRQIIVLEKLPLFGYLWNTFYQTEFLRQYPVKFDTKFKVNEDFMFNMEVFDQVKSFACLDFCGYHYDKRVENSLSTKTNADYFSLHSAKIDKLLTKYAQWQLLDETLIQDIFWLYTRYVYSDICRLLQIKGNEQAKLELQQIFASNLFYRYETIKFTKRSVKESILIKCLQAKQSNLILILSKIMNLAKDKFRILFALIKE